MSRKRQTWAITVIGFIVTLMFLASISQGLEKAVRETFQATAMGESTQLGQMFSVNITIEEYSTPDDQQILVEAFNSAGMKGLCHALSKMKSRGRLAITGTLGYDVSYIRAFPSENGRKIRMVTNRPIRFGEAWTDSRSMDYSLSGVELDISDTKGKSTGVLYPVCEFKIDKEKQLTIETFQNPWKLVNILDR